MLAVLRFLWNATRGHRFTPWRSDYLKWRIETYSGKKAETIDAGEFWRFLWQERVELLRFLAWTEDFAAQSRRRVAPFLEPPMKGESPRAGMSGSGPRRSLPL